MKDSDGLPPVRTQTGTEPAVRAGALTGMEPVTSGAHGSSRWTTRAGPAPGVGGWCPSSGKQREVPVRAASEGPHPIAGFHPYDQLSPEGPPPNVITLGVWTQQWVWGTGMSRPLHGTNS